MKNQRFFTFEFFPSFQNKDDYFEKIISEDNSSGKILSLYILMNCFSVLYGLAMGSYHGFEQAISAGIKIPVLFSLSLIICLPAFFIIQYTLGSRLKLFQMIAVICSGFVLTTAIMVAFVPIVVFFLLTGSNYYFLQLLHILIFIIAGIFGMKTIVDALKYTCEKKGVYPKIGVEVFKFWVVILGIVGIQLAWNLRPFTGDKGKPFALFRNYEGNFYTAVIYSVNQLLSGNEQKSKDKKEIIKERAPNDTFRFFNR
jgi:hypothetical protein